MPSAALDGEVKLRQSAARLNMPCIDRWKILSAAVPASNSTARSKGHEDDPCL